MVAGFRKLTVLEQLEVQREYLEVLDEQKSYLQTWAVAKADHKTRMEEYEERLGDLLTSMRTGFAKPTQVELSLGDEGGSFDGKSYEEARAELVDAAVDRALGDAAPAEGGAKEEVKMPRLALAAGEARAAGVGEGGERDMRVGTPFEKDARVNCNGAFCKEAGTTAELEKKGVKVFVQVVDGRPSVEGWYVGMGIMGKDGGASVAPSIALAPHATRVEAVEHAAGWLRKAGTGLARAEFWREFEEWMVEVRALGATLEGAANG